MILPHPNAKLSDFKDNDLSCKIPDEQRNLFITGANGRGKTYLACAVINAWPARFKEFAKMGKVVEAIRACFNNPNKDEIETTRHFETVPFLVIDDIGAENVTSFSVSKLVEIIDAREARGHVTVVTTNFSLDEVAEKLDTRLRSRFGGYFLVKTLGDDRRRGNAGRITPPPVKTGDHAFVKDRRLWLNDWLKLSKRERISLFGQQRHTIYGVKRLEWAAFEADSYSGLGGMWGRAPDDIVKILVECRDQSEKARLQRMEGR